MYPTLTPTRTIPVELAQARATANTAWRLYDEILDSGNRDAIASALIKASDCDNAAHKWFVRWQALGGTSDIASIVEAEAAPHPAPEDVDAVTSMQARAEQLENELNDPFMTKEVALPALDELARLYDELEP